MQVSQKFVNNLSTSTGGSNRLLLSRCSDSRAGAVGGDTCKHHVQQPLLSQLKPNPHHTTVATFNTAALQARRDLAEWIANLARWQWFLTICPRFMLSPEKLTSVYTGKFLYSLNTACFAETLYRIIGFTSYEISVKSLFVVETEPQPHVHALIGNMPSSLDKTLILPRFKVLGNKQLGFTKISPYRADAGAESYLAQKYPANDIRFFHPPSFLQMVEQPNGNLRDDNAHVLSQRRQV